MKEKIIRDWWRWINSRHKEKRVISKNKIVAISLKIKM